MQETQVWSLDWEDPLSEEMAIHSSSSLESPRDRAVWQSGKELDTTEQLTHKSKIYMKNWHNNHKTS